MKKMETTQFKFRKFSKRQVQVLTWWLPESPHHDKDAIICDGSVRAGKTVVMSLSFVMWATEMFSGENFGMAGKTIGSLRRNVVGPLKRILKGRGYIVQDHRADNYLTITRNGKRNEFYLFGGKDESSQDLIQGVTLAGMLFDEVALMPESFVNQATARCSLEGAKLWFNCNPEGPSHWFNVNWVEQCDQKHALHLHFTMDDNLSLSERVKERYRRMYTGVFYKRYILGLWVVAEGVIFDMFGDPCIVKELPALSRYWIPVDYGTTNPTVFLELGTDGKAMYVCREYRFDSRKAGRQKTDKQYSDDFRQFATNHYERAFVDPSAASFIVQLWQDGAKNVAQADNAVLDGIRSVGSLLAANKLFVHESCKGLIEELYGYVWDTKAQQRGEDQPMKVNDHGVDALRYGINGTRNVWGKWVQVGRGRQ